MAYARLLRIWKFGGGRSRCRKCKRPIRWVIDDRGKSKPFRVDATPLRTEDPDERGRVYEIYEPDAFHKCPAAKKKPARPPAEIQETFL